MPDLQVIYNQFSGGTYFRTSDIRPFIDVDGRLVLQTGVGPRRSWGRWSVRSDYCYVSPSVVEVVVVGWHKHTVSPVGGTYYFVFEDGEWRRRVSRYHVVAAALHAALQSAAGEV